MASSERFPNGLAFGGKEYPIKHFAMHIDEHMETLTTRKTGATYEGWGSPNKRDSDDVEPFFQPIENETLTIERIEVWQMDVDDEREEKPKKKNNIVAEMDGSAALAKRMVGGKKKKGAFYRRNIARRHFGERRKHKSHVRIDKIKLIYNVEYSTVVVVVVVVVTTYKNFLSLPSELTFVQRRLFLFFFSISSNSTRRTLRRTFPIAFARLNNFATAVE